MDLEDDSSNTREMSCTPPLPNTDLAEIEIMKFGDERDEISAVGGLSLETQGEALLELAQALFSKGEADKNGDRKSDGTTEEDGKKLQPEDKEAATASGDGGQKERMKPPKIISGGTPRPLVHLKKTTNPPPGDNKLDLKAPRKIQLVLSKDKLAEKCNPFQKDISNPTFQKEKTSAFDKDKSGHQDTNPLDKGKKEEKEKEKKKASEKEREKVKVLPEREKKREPVKIPVRGPSPSGSDKRKEKPKDPKESMEMEKTVEPSRRKRSRERSRARKDHDHRSRNLGEDRLRHRSRGAGDRGGRDSRRDRHRRSASRHDRGRRREDGSSRDMRRKTPGADLRPKMSNYGSGRSVSKRRSRTRERDKDRLKAVAVAPPPSMKLLPPREKTPEVERPKELPKSVKPQTPSITPPLPSVVERPKRTEGEIAQNLLSILRFTVSPPVISWQSKIVSSATTPVRKETESATSVPTVIRALQVYGDDERTDDEGDDSKAKKKSVEKRKKEERSPKEKKSKKRKASKKSRKKESSPKRRKKSKAKKKEERKRKKDSASPTVEEEEDEEKRKDHEVVEDEEPPTPPPADVTATASTDSTETDPDVSLPEDDSDDDDLEMDEQIINRIKMEKLDERDQQLYGEIQIDYSIVKQEPVTTDEEKDKEKRSVTPVPKVAAEEPPKEESPHEAEKAKFSCSFLNDLGKPDLLATESLHSEEDRNRTETDSPDTDDYASNWEEEFSPMTAKTNAAVVETPKAPKVEEKLADVESEKRARLVPKSCHEEIIPLDDLLNIQNQLKTMKSKLDKGELLDGITPLEKVPSKPAVVTPVSSAKEIPEKLASEYETFMKTLNEENLGLEKADPAMDELDGPLVEGKKPGKRRSSSSTTSSTSSTTGSSSSSSESSSSSSSSTSSSSSDSETDSSSEDKGKKVKKKKVVLIKRKKNMLKPIVSVEELGKMASELIDPEPEEDTTPKKQPEPPKLVIPEHLLPKPRIPTILPTVNSKIYSIRNDSTSDEQLVTAATATTPSPAKPLELERESPVKLKIASKTKLNPAISSSALLGGADEEEPNPKPVETQPPEPPAPRSKRSHDRDRDRDRHRRSKDRSPRRSDHLPPKRRSKERRSRSKSKEHHKRHSLERDRDRRKDRSRHSSSPARRRIRSPPPPRRSSRRTRSRSRSLSPAMLRRPPSPPPQEDRDRRRSSRSSPTFYQRPPSPKEKPPGENQIDVVTSSGGGNQSNDQSPVAGYKKSVADSTISDAELESQKRKPPAAAAASAPGFSESSAYNNMYSKTYGFYGPEDMVLEGPEGGDSPKRPSLDDRINIVLGINGTEVVKPPEHYGDYQPIQTHLHDNQVQLPQQQQQPYPYPGPRPMMHHHYPPQQQQGYPLQDYQQHLAPGYGQPGGPRPPFYRGPAPGQGWQLAPHGSAMSPAGHPHLRPYPNNLYHHPNQAGPPPPLPAAEPGKTLVKQVGNVLEIVPTAVPAPPLKTTPPPTPVEAPTPQTPGGYLLTGAGIDTSPLIPLNCLAPKILTAEELKLRHERRLELKKKIRTEREKKRMEKKMRKEKLKMEVKRLLGETATVATVSSDEEDFDEAKHQAVLASLNRNYDKSILRTKTGACVARKTVLFADGVAPGDESSSSGAEALRSPAKITASKQRKRLRRKRTLKATGRKRLMERLKLPDLDLEEKEQVDPELEAMPPPPPPPGSPPPMLPQPRCINPPPVQMIDFRDAPPMLPFRASGGTSTPSSASSSGGPGMPSSAYSSPAGPGSASGGSQQQQSPGPNGGGGGGPGVNPGASTGGNNSAHPMNNLASQIPPPPPPGGPSSQNNFRNLPPHMRPHLLPTPPSPAAHHHYNHLQLQPPLPPPPPPGHMTHMPPSHPHPSSPGMMDPGGMMKKPPRSSSHHHHHQHQHHRGGPDGVLVHPIETIGSGGPVPPPQQMPMRYSLSYEGGPH